MARILKEDEYNAKRSEILAVALHLIYTRGYQQMTIQDILDQLHISRGALYHYFASKQSLLEALVDRMGREAEQAILPIVHDPYLSALEKFRRYFEMSARWKEMQKELITSLLRMWYSDENAFFRQKMNAESIPHTARLLEPIISQGVAEKVFTTRFPVQAAEMIASIAIGFSDTIIGLLFSSRPDREKSEEFETVMEAYSDTVERILGAPEGSLKIIDPAIFSNWVAALQS
jgi:TetR/AcrR family transcriptional repressor of nem operon